MTMGAGDAIAASAALDTRAFIAALNTLLTSTDKASQAISASLRTLQTALTQTTQQIASGAAAASAQLTDLTVATGEAGTAAKAASTSFSGLSRSIAGTEAAAGTATATMSTFEEGVAAASAEATSFGSVLGIVGTELGAMEASFSTAGAKVSAFAGQINVFGAGVSSTMKKAASDINTGITPAFDRLGQSEKDLLGVQNAMNGLFRAGTQLSSVGQTLGIMGAVILGVGAAAMNASSGFDFWARRALDVSNVQGTLTDATGKTTTNLQAMKDAVATVAETTGAFNLADTAHGYELWNSDMSITIHNQDDLNKSMAEYQTILKAAAMGNVDYETATRGVASVLKEWGLGSDAAIHVTQELFNVTQQTGAEFTDMIAAFQKMGPLAAAVGMDTEQVTALVAKLNDVGITGSLAGRSAAQMLASLADPSKKAATALDEVLGRGTGLGQTWEQALYPGGQFIGVLDHINTSGQVQEGLISKLADGMGNLSAAQQEQVLKQMSSQNVLRDYVPLVDQRLQQLREQPILEQQLADAQQKATDGTQASADALKNAQDAMDTFNAHLSQNMIKNLEDVNAQSKIFDSNWQDVSQSIKIQWGQAMNTLQVGLADIGTVAQQAIMPMITNITTLLGYVERWMRDNQDLAEGIMRVVVAIGSVLAVLGVLGFVAGQLIQLVTMAQQIAMAWQGFLEIIMTAVTALNGLVLVILGVVAGLAILAQQGGQAWKTFTDSLNSAISDALKLMGTFLNDILYMVQDLANGDWNDAWNRVKDIAVGIITWIVENVPKLVSEFGTALSTAITNVFGPLPMQFLQWGENLMNSLGGGIMNGLDNLMSIVESVATSIGSFFKSFSPPKTGPLKDIGTWGTNLMKSLADGMNDGTSHATAAAQQIGQAMSDHLTGKTGALKDVGSWGANLAKAFADGFSTAGAEHVDNAAADTADAFRPKLEGHSPAQEGPLSDIDSWAQNLADVYANSFSTQAAEQIITSSHTVAQAMRQAYDTQMQSSLEQIAADVSPTAGKTGQVLMQGVYAGFSKADFSVLDNVSSAMSTAIQTTFAKALKEAKPEGKSLLTDAMVGDQQQAKDDLTQAISQINGIIQQQIGSIDVTSSDVQGQMEKLSQSIKDGFDPTAINELASAVPEAAGAINQLMDAMMNQQAAQAFNDQLDAVIAKSKETEQDIQTIINGINQEIQGLKASELPDDTAITADQSKVNNLTDAKDNYNSDIESHQNTIDGSIDNSGAYHAGLNDHKAEIQDTIDGIQAQIDAKKALADEDDAQIQKLQDENKGYQDQITAIKAVYDAQTQADQAKSAGIQAQIDSQKALNDQIEYGIQVQLDAAMSSGADAAHIETLQKQLAITKQHNSTMLQGLTIQKELQDSQNEANKQSRDQAQLTQIDPLQGKINANNQSIQTVTADKQTQSDAEKALQLQISQQNLYMKSVDKQIAAQEQAIKLDQMRQKNIDDQIKVVQADEKVKQADKANIENHIKAIQDGELADAQNALNKQKATTQELEARKSVAQQELQAAQSALDLAEKVIDEQKKTDQGTITMANAAGAADKSSGASGNSLPGGAGFTGPNVPNLKDITDQVTAAGDGLKTAFDNLLKPMGDTSADLDARRKDIEGKFDALGTGIQAKLATLSGIFMDNSFFKEAHAAFTNLLFDLGKDIPGIVQDLADGNLTKAIADFQKLFTDMEADLAPLGDWFDTFGTKLNDIIHTKLEDIFGLFRGNQINDVLHDFFKIPGDLIGTVASTFSQITATIADTIANPDSFKDLPGKLLAILEGALESVKTSAGGDLNKLGQDLFGSGASGQFDQLGRVFSQFSDGLGSMADALKTIIPPIAGLVMDVLGPAFAALGSTFKSVAQILDEHKDSLAEAFNTIGPVLQLIATVLGFLIGTLIVGFVEGVINLIEGIAKVIKGFEQLGGAFGDFLHGNWAQGFQELKDGILNILGGLFQGIVGLLETGFVGPLGFFGDLGGRFLGMAVKGLDGFGPRLIEMIVGKLGDVAPLAEKLGGWFVDALGNIGGKLGAGAGKIGSSLLDMITSGLGALKDVLAGSIGKLLSDAFGGAVKAIGGVIRALGSDFMHTFLDPMAGLKDAWGEIFNQLGTVISGAFGHVWDVVQPALAALWSNITGFVSAGVANLATALVDGLVTHLATVLGAIATFVGAGIDVFNNLFTTITGTTIPNLINGIIDWVKKLPGEVLTTIQTWVNDVVTWFTTLWDKLVGHSIIPDLINAIIDWIAKLPNEVLATITTWVGNVINWFGNLKDGVVGKATDLFNGVRDIWNNLVTAVQGIIGVDDSSGFRGFVHTAWAAIATGIGTILGTDDSTGLRGVIHTAWNAVTTIFNTILGTDDSTGLRGIVHTAWNGISTAISTVLGSDDKTGLRGVISGAWNAVTTTVGSILGTDDKSGLRGVFKTAWDGVSTAISTVLGTDDKTGIRGVIATVWTWIRDNIIAKILGADSKDTTSIWGKIVAAWEGIKDNIDTALNGINSLISNFAHGMAGLLEPAMEAWQALQDKANAVMNFLHDHGIGGGGSSGSSGGSGGGSSNNRGNGSDTSSGQGGAPGFGGDGGSPGGSADSLKPSQNTIDAIMNTSTASYGGDSLTMAQFGSGLPYYDAICSEIAAAGMAKAFGRDVDVNQLRAEAQANSWWTPDLGVIRGSFPQIAAAAGVDVKMGGWADAIAALAQGKPAAINTAHHYFLAQGYDPGTGLFDLGNSGANVYGHRYLTADQISAYGGGFNNTYVPYADGGQMFEPIVGKGMWSGRGYRFNEKENEVILNQGHFANVTGALRQSIEGLYALSQIQQRTQVPTLAQQQYASGSSSTAGGAGGEVHLHVGVLVADQAGLKALNDQLRKINVVENVRRGKTSVA